MDGYGYDRDDDLYSNPLMSQEALRYMELAHAVQDGTAYEKFGYDPDGTERERREEKYMEYDPGIHSRCFKGTSQNVNRSVNNFHRVMHEKYDNYQVIDTTAAQLANGTSLYVTFSV